MKFIFIADFFVDEILGGGELNNDELIKSLSDLGYSVRPIKSQVVNISFLEENKAAKFIISNFIGLSQDCKNFLLNLDYIIYEHDHKYLKSRNPAIFKNFIAPKEEIINFEFYKQAKAVFCQSSFHTNIVKKNLELDNIVNIGGNLWPLLSLEKMKDFAKKNKTERCSIMNSPITHKNTYGAIKYCEKKELSYELIDSCSYYKFLDRLSNNSTFIFLPQTPETLSRVVVEARMMNMKVITNGLVGASREDWFKLKGEELINLMIDKRKEIPKKVFSEFAND